MRKKICLITSGHIASNPRIVKEANVLVEAGYDVNVIYLETTKSVCNLDRTVLEKSNWKYKNLNIGTIYKRAYRKILNRFFKLFCRLFIPSLFFARQAQSPFTNLLVDAAKSYPADLYIGHNPPALPAVYIASIANNARFGFDAEDFHTGEDIEGRENRITGFIENKLLNKAAYLISASPMISEQYYKSYGIKPESILNVFPLSSREEVNFNKYKDVPSLYWFSQTVGPNRGLEKILFAVSKMNIDCNIYFRGDTSINGEFISRLIKIAEDLDINKKLHFLNTEKPDDMIKLASIHDLGLSIEPGITINNNICLGNKIFTYLLAGIPVLLSKTKAQAAIAEELGDAAILVDINNPAEVAEKLDEYFSSPEKMSNAKKTAMQLAETKYNWDVEKQKFLRIVNSLFSQN